MLAMYDIFVVLCSSPVQDVADSCRTRAATNVIFGLALGYKSVIIPIFAIAFSIFLSFSLAAIYGVDVAALGMLSTIATGLGMSHRIRERTDALDAAGNTTAAYGKVDYMLILSEFHVIAHRTKDFSV
jgi:H+-translocating diphosphatase